MEAVDVHWNCQTLAHSWRSQVSAAEVVELSVEMNTHAAACVQSLDQPDTKSNNYIHALYSISIANWEIKVTQHENNQCTLRSKLKERSKSFCTRWHHCTTHVGYCTAACNANFDSSSDQNLPFAWRLKTLCNATLLGATMMSMVMALKKVKGAMPQLGRKRGAHLPLTAVEPVGG